MVTKFANYFFLSIEKEKKNILLSELDLQPLQRHASCVHKKKKKRMQNKK